MQAIIFADRLGSELHPLCENTPLALLPLANRPLLEYTLDDLAMAGIKEVFIVSSQTRQLEEHFAHGEMWGLRLHYLLSRGEESPAKVLARNLKLFQLPFLALRGDILRSPCCENFISHSLHKNTNKKITELTFDGKKAAVMLVHQLPEQVEAFNGLQWPLSNYLTDNTVDMATSRIASIDNFKSFYDANMQTVEGLFGLQTSMVQEIEPGLQVEPHGKVTPLNRESGIALIGEETMIDPQVRLLGPVIIGKHCYIDSAATIIRSIILPGSYIGCALQVENAIICGHHLIRIDHNLAIQVSDPSVIAYVNHEVEAFLGSLTDRTLALLLLVMSLPLWPIAILLSVLTTPLKPLQPFTILSNRSNTDSVGKDRLISNGWQLTTRVPLLRALPMLWLVICGDLRLFGSEPLQFTQSSKHSASSELPCWDRRHHHSCAGLIGPAQLDLPRDVPEEELRLNESYFIEQSGLIIIVQRLLKSVALLFSSRAWFNSEKRISLE